MVDLMEIAEDEVLIIKHSGEIPEIAFHGCINYLQNDPDGPGLGEIPDAVMKRLVDAVIERYRFITLRDLIPRNRDKRIYRGVARSIVNWKRLCCFAEKHGIDVSGIRKEVADALGGFVVREVEDVSTGLRNTSINCTFESLIDFAEMLAADISPSVRTNLRAICPDTQEY